MKYNMGMIKNIPANSNLMNLIKNNTYNGTYRCQYPSILLNYPIDTPGILSINNNKTVSKLTYICKDGIYNRTIYNNNQDTGWLRVSKSDNMRKNNLFDEIGLFSNNELKNLILKYLKPYNDAEVRAILNTKATLTEAGSYIYKAESDRHHGHLRFGGDLYLDVNTAYHMEIPTSSGIRVRHYNTGALRQITGAATYDNYNNNDGTMSVNLIGNYLDSTNIYLGESAPLRHKICRYSSDGRPVLESLRYSNLNGQTVALKEDLTWKLIFDQAGTGTASITFPGNSKECLVQFWLQYSDGSAEDVAPVLFIPGKYHNISAYHGCYQWNKTAHAQLNIMYDSDRVFTSQENDIRNKSICKLCATQEPNKHDVRIYIRRAWYR